MKKYVKIWYRCVRMCYISTMMYKFNYVVGAGLTIFNMAAELLFIWYVFYLADIKTIAGVDYIVFFFVYGLFELIRSVMRAGVMDNSYFVQEGVHSGELDEFLIKPVNFKFITSVRFFWPEQIMMGLVVLGFLVVLSAINGFFGWGWIELGQVIFIVISSLIIYFLFIWIVSLMAFYWDRFNQIKSIFWISGQASNYPRKIFPRLLQWAGMFVVPVFLVINPVFDVFTGSYGWENIINTGLYLVALFIAYQLVWKVGLRKYNSAN